MSVLEQVNKTDMPVEAQSDDDLISVLLDETESKEKGVDDVETAIYPDFEAPDPGDYPAPDMSEPGDLRPDGEDTPVDEPQKILMSLVDLPVETIVDTVDMTLTDLIVRGCKIEDADESEADKIMTSEAEKAALVKATNKYLESQKIKVTPLTGLLVTVGMVYGKKLMYGLRLKKMIARNNALQEEIEQLRNERDEMERRLIELQHENEAKEEEAKEDAAE